MVFTCCVVGCYNRSGREKSVSFYSIPAVVEHQGDKTKNLSLKRRCEWIQRINRTNWTPSKYARVCSDHFHSGRPSMLYDEINVDWAPSLKMGNAITVSSWHEDSPNSLKERSIIKRELEVAEAMLLLSEMDSVMPSTAAGKSLTNA